MREDRCRGFDGHFGGWMRGFYGRWRQLSYLLLRCHDVPRHLDAHDAGPARKHLTKRFVDNARRIGRAFDALRPFDEAADRRQLIAQFVQVTAAASDELARHLAGDA